MATRLDDGDLRHLQSILDQLRELRATVTEGPSMASWVLTDNIDWLSCFIEKEKRT